MRVDLHIHTTFSDGDRTPEEVALEAARLGLYAFAITDHDECRGCAALNAAAGRAVTGIELAAQQDAEVHVLGYLIDCASRSLTAHVRSAAAARQKRAEEIVARLNAGGLAVSMDDVRGACGGSVIGRPHIAAALVKKGYAASVADAFDRHLKRGAPYYVPQKKIGVRRAAELILEAGGLPVLAHPGLLPAGVFAGLLPELKGMGFWGVEAYHPAHTDARCVEYESLARALGLYVTAGSDFHGHATPRVGIGQETRTSRYLKESVLLLIKQSEKDKNYNAHDIDCKYQ